MDSAPSVLLRTDAHPSIGMGHWQRMSALAHAVRALGAKPFFVLPRAAHAGLVAQGVAASELIDAGAGVEAWGAEKASAVVLDTLWSGNAAATIAEVDALAGRGHRVAVIDSMPPDHFPGDPALRSPELVVTPYLGARSLRPAPRARHWLAGAEYAILGPDYATPGASFPPPSPPRLLISCGGSDPDGLSAEIIANLVSRGWPVSDAGPLGVDLIVGPMFTPDLLERLRSMAAMYPSLDLHAAPHSLAPFIARASVVVGRLGLLRYEAAALQRGGVYLHGTDTYRPYLEGFEKTGVARIFFATDPWARQSFFQTIHDSAVHMATAGDSGAAIFPPAVFSAFGSTGAKLVARAVLGDEF